jgi:hypothetical protein
MMKLTIGILSLVLFIATFNQAGAEGVLANSWARATYQKKHVPLPTFKRGEPYSALRERLVNSGWQPASNAQADQCEKGDSRCDGRPEMQECAGTGEANCNFRWRKANTVVDVNTITETPVVTEIRPCVHNCR